jgi:hypothetical protein
MVANDITPQKRTLVGSIALVSRLMRITMTGIMPAMRALIDSHWGAWSPGLRRGSFRRASPS